MYKYFLQFVDFSIAYACSGQFFTAAPLTSSGKSTRLICFALRFYSFTLVT